MKFATALLPPKLKNHYAQIAAWLLGGIFLLLVLVQLVRFEKFIPLVESYMPDGGVAVGQVIAALLVTVEVFALPFLLRMKISPLMRVFSMVCGWLASLLLLALAIIIVSATPTVIAINSFGIVLDIASGDWMVWGAAGIVALTGVTSYLLRSDIIHSRADR